MDFRTELIVPPSRFRISHNDKILTAGSCFAQVTGDKLTDYKFQVLNNPFGTIFNPLSLFKLLEASVSGHHLEKSSFLQRDGYWYNYHLHSSIKADSPGQLEKIIQDRCRQVEKQIKEASYIILTLGTAFIYELAETGEPVANCHKMPQKLFRKRLLTAEEILKQWNICRQIILAANPDMRFIISVSPVRHIKDTLPMNSLSKALLRIAAHEMTQEQNVEYFPAYELLTDDLRDYRFYKEDMIHPTAQAEQYIWEKFSGCFFSPETQSLNQEWGGIAKALQHKAFSPEAPGHKQFLVQTLNRLKSLQDKLQVSSEIEELESRIQE